MPRTRSSPEQNGVVVSVAIGSNSNALYSIRWGDGSEGSPFNTWEVLLRAVAGQGVVSLQDEKILFERFLRGALRVAYVHGYQFLIQDKNKIKDPKPGVLLDDGEKIWAGKIRSFVWDTIENLAASETVSHPQRELLTRPRHLGSIRGNSEHSSMVAPTCKNPAFFRFASRSSPTRDSDCAIQDKICKSYSVVSAKKRDVKSVIETVTHGMH